MTDLSRPDSPAPGRPDHARPEHARPEHARPVRHVFVVTYGRSGSTVLQHLMNRLPGVCIRGENHNLSYHLARAWAGLAENEATQSHRRKGNTLGPTHPWYGSEQVDPDGLGRDLAHVLAERVLAVPPGTEIAGFKEIRWHQDAAFFGRHLEFLRRFFADSRFIFNTRDHAAVAQSGWWRDCDPGWVRETLAAADRLFAEYAAANPGLCWQVRYDDYAGDAQALRPVFEALGRPYDGALCAEVLGERLTHLQPGRWPGKAP
ncbi:sulfotransferase family protein [Rhodovulum bhavnagarense]|uniref:Sulfotransferase family protein n=1 Tax=Rhodovulum bhavnagarense TaxID=992286 RepID=A0A4R2RFP0_9RHOB|nr:sulfotransferase [Rhodovulum bhavnagarense]TCP58451.1 sulfotransferase family protein [Rhodovulum bhavnagarense]